MRYSTCVVFGGAGFIGSHLTHYLLQNNIVTDVYIADIVDMSTNLNFDSVRTHFVSADIRNQIDSAMLPQQVDLIINLAAVHREPGHFAYEYFETNIKGAENVCAWAEQVGCTRLIFTSSIATYGTTETPKTEDSLPTPTTPYGSSKLVAEKIHLIWQAKCVDRKLVIVRPGVIFGAGENGNVTRLVQATIRHYFFYMGNKGTRKAGGYVKELVRSLIWALDKVNHLEKGTFLYNFTMDPPPTVEDYVLSTCTVAGNTRFIPNVPYSLLYWTSSLVELVTKPFGIKHPINPKRISKLVKSNSVRPEVLRKEEYEYIYTLEEAFQDWKAERPLDWK